VLDVVNRRTKVSKREWHQKRPRNEALDCRIYARAAAYDCGYDRNQAKSWERFGQIIDGMTAAVQRVPIAPAPARQPAEGERPGVSIKEIRGGGYLSSRASNWFGR
jgi:phage terminase large subunit GpA-like protein